MASPTVKLYLPDLHDLQDEVAIHPARFKVLACGRRVGKTELAKDLLINSIFNGEPYAYFAPTYRNMREMWDRVKATAIELTINISTQDRRMTFVGDGVIEFWSLDAIDAMRGRAYAGVVIDEAAQVANLEYAWNEAIRPALTDFKGWALFLSTPRGRDYFWQLYLRGQDDLAFEDWQSWQRPTTDNPHIDPLEVEAAREEMPERAFKQEYLAEFLEDGGAVFRNVTACATMQTGHEPDRNFRYVFGVDWGKSEDFTAIAVLRHDGALVELDRFNEIGWALQRARLTALFDKWRPTMIVAETNAMGDPNVEALQYEGLPVEGFQTTATTKPPLIESLALAFERHEIAILNDPVLVHELQAYTMERLPSGRFRYSAPSGMHDDTVIALALAWHGANNAPLFDAELYMAPQETYGIGPY